jgi:F-type H+-transporting ATPase subunit alpha
MKKVAGRLRLDLAQFRELESFAAFGSDLDAASKAAIARGSRLVELLKQPQYSPFPMEKAVVSIWAGTTGRLDEVPVEDVRRFEAEFLHYLESNHADVMAEIRETRDLSDGNIEKLVAGIATFKKSFMKSDGTPLIVDEQFDALAESDIKRATVTRTVRN